ncbi:hypothetical protein J6590_003385, partial [Homalodisca vitripennis]
MAIVAARPAPCSYLAAILYAIIAIVIRVSYRLGPASQLSVPVNPGKRHNTGL